MATQDEISTRRDPVADVKGILRNPPGFTQPLMSSGQLTVPGNQPVLPCSSLTSEEQGMGHRDRLRGPAPPCLTQSAIDTRRYR